MNKEARVICEFEMDFKKYFCWRSNLSNDNIISAYARSESGYGFYRPGVLFSKVPITFLAGKLFYVCRVCTQDQGFNNFEDGTMKLSVNEVKLTGFLS